MNIVTLWRRLFGNTNETDFAGIVKKAISERGETRQIEYDVQNFMLVAKGEPNVLLGHVRQWNEKLPDRTRLSMRRRYMEYSSASRGQRRKIIDELADRWFTLPTEESDYLKSLEGLVTNLQSTDKTFLRNLFGEDFETLERTAPKNPKKHNLQIKIDVPSGYQLDGDSMGLTIALGSISHLTDLPLDQGLAITGAMNKSGEVLPVDGIKLKVEAWFDQCKRNWTGQQGVIIPKANESDLSLLGPEIIEAVRNNSFRVYCVKHIDEAIMVASGQPIARVREILNRKFGSDNI